MTHYLLRVSLRFFLPLISGLLFISAAEAEKWQCELNLHQGDSGTLEFTRQGNNISGQTVVSRNTGAGPFTHQISGDWHGEIIEFKRTLNPSSSHQMFRGIALHTKDSLNNQSDMRPGDPTIRMSGRFAFKYSGIWSADCRKKPMNIHPGLRPGILQVPDLKPVPQRHIKPKTHRTGELKIPQTYQADLDQGKITSDKSVDIWFQAKTATDRYITPRNKALIGVAGTKSINRAGCAALHLSRRSIPLSEIPEGTYVCVKTNEGRFSQFRVNARVGRSPGVLKIGFTTWK
ncbi:MAG: hypothetical protein OEM02_01285 [Desulfobulbaceae bacterium]|nr:hypothetical protein [Desulfobulbaceae bacterium]